MTSKKRRIVKVAGILFAGSLFWTAVSCNNNTNGGGGGTGGSTGNQTISIDAFTFSPTELNAKPGEVIKIVNNDSTTHTVTSESVLNAFDDNGDFDTNDLNAGQQSSITIPTNATPGDQLFWYCAIHESMMTTPNGTITVVAP